VTNSLEALRQTSSVESPVTISLMNGSTLHSVKRSLGAHAGGPAPSRRKLSTKVVTLGAFSAVLGLNVAASLSRLRTRTDPVVQIVSGTPVLKKSLDGDSVRWHSGEATLYLDASLDALGSQARDAVRLGFGTWLSSGANLPGLSFDSTKGAQFGQTANGQSEISYGPITVPGHETALALTIIFSDSKTGEVLEADMRFNSLYPYGLLSGKDGSDDEKASYEDKYDLQNVATHEAGHFFGLGEDYDATSATMYYTTGPRETNKRVLQTSDETTMDSLYVANATQTEGGPSAVTAKGCGGARIGQGNTRGEAPVLALLGLLGFVSWRRRRR
jgi:Matrixin